MSKVLKYNGYIGSVETSIDDGCLYGKLLFVRDLVSYEAQTIPELKKEFEIAVDDYLELCAELGTEPKKPCSGIFNVRIQPEVHEVIACKAVIEGTTLNQLVSKAIDCYLQDDVLPQENHYHEHKTIFVGEISGSNEIGVIPSERFEIISEGTVGKSSVTNH